MAGENEVALEILVAGAFVEGAGSDEVFALDADVLVEDEVAVEGVEGEVRSAAEHDGAGDVVDAGALGWVSTCPLVLRQAEQS